MAITDILLWVGLLAVGWGAGNLSPPMRLPASAAIVVGLVMALVVDGVARAG